MCIECEDAPATYGQLCRRCDDRIEREGRKSEMALRAAREARRQRKRNYRIIDENGVECWAGELAERYRAETQPRGVLPLWYFRG